MIRRRATPPSVTPEPSALFTLLAGAIDYAGLFPPAALAMPEAVRNYAAYRGSSDRWALGSFIVPLARLGEFDAAYGAIASADDSSWPISAIGGDDPDRDAEIVAAFNTRRRAPGAVIDAIEAVVRSPEDAARRIALSAGLDCFCEVDMAVAVAGRAAWLQELLVAIRAAGGYAKLRSGGLTPAAIPATSDLAAAIERCVELALAFKATAGLHHPFRGVHPLGVGAERGRMHGFVCLGLATALLAAPVPGDDVRADALRVLDADGRGDFSAAEGSLRWLGLEWNPARVAAGRALFTSFGSCSFDDPLADLRMLGLLAHGGVAA